MLAVSGHGEALDEVAVTFKCSVGLADSDIDDFVVSGDLFGIF